MNYITSDTSEINNNDFLGLHDTTTDVSLTSPFSLNSDTQSTIMEQNNQTGGFWPFSSNSDKLLYIALIEKNVDAAIFLAKHLKDISHTKNGKTILHYIVHEYNSIPRVNEIARVILSRNDIRNIINEKEDVSGDTALHIAARNGNYDLCTMLVQAGANQKIKNNDGLYIISETEPEVVSSPHGRIINNMREQYNNTSFLNDEPSEQAVKHLLNNFLSFNRTPQCSETEMTMPSHLSINTITVDTPKNTETFNGGMSENDQLLNTICKK